MGMTNGELGLIVALVIQFGGLVWGAAQVASSVNSLRLSVDKLDKTVEHLDNRVQNHEARMAVIERVQQITGGAG